MLMSRFFLTKLRHVLIHQSVIEWSALDGIRIDDIMPHNYYSVTTNFNQLTISPDQWLTSRNFMFICDLSNTWQINLITVNFKYEIRNLKYRNYIFDRQRRPSDRSIYLSIGPQLCISCNLWTYLMKYHLLQNAQFKRKNKKQRFQRRGKYWLYKVYPVLFVFGSSMNISQYI